MKLRALACILLFAASCPAAPRLLAITANAPSASGDSDYGFGASTSDNGDQVVIQGSDNYVPAGKVVPRDVVGVFTKVIVDGEVKRDAVSVLATTVIDGRVDRDAVAVLGDLRLGPHAWVERDAVCIGGHLYRDPGAHVGGRLVEEGFWIPDLGRFLHRWPDHGRRAFPIRSFPGYLLFVWIFGLFWLGVYALVALAAPNAIRRCGNVLAERPGTVILTSFLSLVGLPILFVLLCITLLGIPVAILFLPLATFCAMCFGKASIYALLGRAISKDRMHPALAVLVGGLIFFVVYSIPILGALINLAVSTLGIGCSVATILVTRGTRPPPPLAPIPAGMPAPAAPVASPVPPPPSASEPVPAPLESIPAPPPPSPAPAPLGVEPVRAGFWIRFLALLIDLILVAFVLHLAARVIEFAWNGFADAIGAYEFHVNVDCPAAFFTLLAVYAAVLWRWRGTTIGGAICNLHVVRLDGRPVDWPTAIVRALGCFPSILVVGLGFMWVAFDPERQSWHDKIAGTVVVHPPTRRSLV